MKARLNFLLMAPVAAVLAGCVTYCPTPEVFYKANIEPYRLGAGDRVRVTVHDQPDLSNAYNVDQTGRIAFPLVGRVAAAGNTTRGVETEIARKLRQGYLRNPDVSVEVVRYRAIFVTGEIAEAGQYSFAPGMTAQKAIAAAGGFSGRADKTRVDIIRTIGGKQIKGRVPISEPIMPGDIIQVRQRLF